MVDILYRSQSLSSLDKCSERVGPGVSLGSAEHPGAQQIQRETAQAGGCPCVWHSHVSIQLLTPGPVALHTVHPRQSPGHASLSVPLI